VPSEPRAALGARKARRPHPASPDAVEASARRPPDVARAPSAELVMLCVRVSPSLRRRLKLAAATTGRPVQALATEALDALCKQHDR
jgi:hypothetical protein